VRSAVEWAEVRALAADGVSQRQIAVRLGIHRKTVKRLLQAPEPPRYARAPVGSMLDPLEPVLRDLLAKWPDIKAPRVTEILREDYDYAGSVDLVKKRLAMLRPRAERPAQKTGYRPGQVAQFDWAEMPTRPKIGGRERRVYALVATLPFSGAHTAHFTFCRAARPLRLPRDGVHAGYAEREGRRRRRRAAPQDGVLARQADYVARRPRRAIRRLA
jgi:transposase